MLLTLLKHDLTSFLYCPYQAFRRSFFSRNCSSNGSFVKIHELFLFPLLFSRNRYFSRSFFSSFSPDAKPATRPTSSSWLLYILRLILLYFTAVLNYLIVFIIILLNFIKKYFSFTVFFFSLFRGGQQNSLTTDVIFSWFLQRL